MAIPRARQRADLTFKHNREHGRHGWLRLTPAYSVKIVNQVLNDLTGEGLAVLDPFSGTGTTSLCAAYKGHAGTAIDINPFLIWFAKTKGRRYSESEIEELLQAGERILAAARKGLRPASPPAIANIDKWWDRAELAFLRQLKAALYADETTGAPVGDLLRVAFSRTVIALSNAGFNRVSMTLKEKNESNILPLIPAATRHAEQFKRDLDTVATDARDNPAGNVEIIRADSRDLTLLSNGNARIFDVLITSPPYPNRISYIRELRPYMYWLDYIVAAREAGELDWDTIGGTWGIATSRLADWKPQGAFVPSYLAPILDRIRGSHPKNGMLMSQYILKYFEDMSRHFMAARRVVRPGGAVHYIIGNSVFYGHPIPSERLYEDLLRNAGFANVGSEIVRKRNSKKLLYEFHVRATA